MIWFQWCEFEWGAWRATKWQPATLSLRSAPLIAEAFAPCPPSDGNPAQAERDQHGLKNGDGGKRDKGHRLSPTFDITVMSNGENTLTTECVTE